MADWYVSSAVYSALPAWAASTPYTVGQIVRPVAQTSFRQLPQRCTAAGTSGSAEPSWNISSNQPTTDGGVTWTNVAGLAAYAWSAPMGNLYCLMGAGNIAVGGPARIFVSSDHSESGVTGVYGFPSGGYPPILLFSVNRAGSVPPVASDLQNGAAITNSGVTLDATWANFWQGFVFTASSTNITFQSSGMRAGYFKNCAFVLSNAGGLQSMGTGNPGKAIWDNCTLQVANAASRITGSGYDFDLTWINTASAIQGATLPSNLAVGGGGPLHLTVRGVDLSALTGALLSPGTQLTKILLDGCKINASLTRSLASPLNGMDEIELVNCYDGTNVVLERHTPAGDLVVDRTTTLASGAVDDYGAYALKMTSSSRCDNLVMPLDSFWLDVENGLTGNHTATVECISQASLNNVDIALVLEYLGTSGSPQANFVFSLPSALTPSAALPTSSNTWAATATYATWSPAALFGSMALSNGNLTATGNTGGLPSGVFGTIGFASGKYYFEVTMATWTNSSTYIGIAPSTANSVAGNSGNGAGVGKAGGSNINGVSFGSGLGARANGDIIGVAVDFNAQLIWFRVCPSGNWNGSSTANPATGVGGGNIAPIMGVPLYPYFDSWNATDVATANFGATAFTGAVPSGFTTGWPTTPTFKQLLQVSFNAQGSGRVRGLVRLGKPSVNVWVNPQVTIT